MVSAFVEVGGSRSDYLGSTNFQIWIQFFDYNAAFPPLEAVQRLTKAFFVFCDSSDYENGYVVIENGGIVCVFEQNINQHIYFCYLQKKEKKLQCVYTLGYAFWVVDF